MNTNLKKIITLLSVIILFLIIVFTIIPNRNKRNLDIKPVDDVRIATTTEELTFDEENDFYIISAKYPKEIEVDIKKIINDTKTEWGLDGELYKNEMKLREDFPDRPIIKYELNIQYEKFTSINLETISYIVRSYMFTGGAHGNTALITYTFNKNGLVKIENILNLDNENDLKLTKIILNKLEGKLGEYLNLDMLKDGLGLGEGTGFDYTSNLENFIVIDEGIIFIYGQYQVAPYAAGQPEVLLRWEELEGYLQ